MGTGNQAYDQKTGQAQQGAALGAPNLEAEHDPQRSRKVSRAGLEREAHKRGAEGGTANAEELQDNADQAAYESLFSAIDLLANRMRSGCDEVHAIMAQPEDAGGVFKKAAEIEQIRDTLSNELGSLRTMMQRVTIASYRPLGKDLDALGTGLDEFITALMVARARYGKETGFQVDPRALQGELKLMYAHAGLDMAAASTDGKSAALTEDPEKLENIAIVSAEASIQASLQAVRAKFPAPEAELHAEVAKLVTALEQTRMQLETMANPSRIHSTHKLATLLHETGEVIVELDKKPAIRQYLANVGAFYTITALRSHLKK